MRARAELIGNNTMMCNAVNASLVDITGTFLNAIRSFVLLSLTILILAATMTVPVQLPMVYGSNNGCKTAVVFWYKATKAIPDEKHHAGEFTGGRSK